MMMTLKLWAYTKLKLESGHFNILL